MVIDPKHVKNMVCQCQSLQKLQVGHKDVTKTYKFDLEVKGQHQNWIMNVRDTLPYGKTPYFGKPMSIQK